MDEGWLVGAPQSSQAVSPRGYGWGDRERAVQEVGEHYKALIHSHPVDPDQIVLAGFSQGGSTAVSIALSGLLPARGVFGVACAARDADDAQQTVSAAAARHLRVYLLVGELDYALKTAAGLADILKSAGVKAHLEIRPALGHELPQDFGPSLIQELEFLSD